MFIFLSCFLSCQVLDKLVFFLAVILSEAYFHCLTQTLYRGLFCHFHLCPYIAFDISLTTGSFKLATLFLQVSSLVKTIKGLRDNQCFLIRRVCQDRRTAAVSVIALMKWMAMESRSASLSPRMASGANLPHIGVCKTLSTVG